MGEAAGSFLRSLALHMWGEAASNAGGEHKGWSRGTRRRAPAAGIGAGDQNAVKHRAALGWGSTPPGSRMGQEAEGEGGRGRAVVGQTPCGDPTEWVFFNKQECSSAPP
eukprot:EG_transcript_12894